MSELESFVSQASQLTSKLDFWNAAVIVGLVLTFLGATVVMVSQRYTNLRAKQIAVVQDSIATIKENKANERAKALEKAAADAKAAQQQVETALSQQQEKTAEAERSLLQLQRRLEPRRISADQKQRLIVILGRNLKGNISVTCVLGDHEGQVFANDVNEVLTASGWTTQGVTQAAYAGVNPVGFGLVVRDGRNAPALAAELQRAFFAIGIPLAGAEDPHMPPDEIHIIVGNKPN